MEKQQCSASGLSRGELKTLGLSSLGGILEFYDFIIVFFFAKIISQHFFPAGIGEFWAMLNTYGTFAAGYLARPLGGVVMAHFGDKFGRKNMFMLSIALMVIPTFSLAVIPTYETIGYAAPLFLILVRICQGIAIGGELPGAWVFIHEHAPAGHKNAFVGFLTGYVTGGILLGSFVALLMNFIYTPAELSDWAWRVPFVIGGVFGLISIYLRRFLQETPVFKKMRESKALAKFPLEEVVKTSRFGIWISMFITWVLTGCIVVFILLMPGFVGGVLGFSPFETTYFQMGGLVCIVSSCWLTGRLADKHNPSTLCILFSAGFAVSSVAFFSLLYTAAPVVSEVVLAYFATCFFAGIMNFCPIFMCDVFPARIRFSGISFAYNIAYALSGAFTPQLSFALHAYAKTHPDTLGAMGLSAYIVFLALVSIGTALAMRRVYKNGGAAVSQMEFRPAP
ncbi:MFS transporter [Sutterella wadsworthensis]|uniref:MFS transporter n=1 Tax=Sutterella wadsworthensis TaxID=40545 RepID=UPI0013F67951|nr:MFS transporter [Sutterella wadsworthensis]